MILIRLQYIRIVSAQALTKRMCWIYLDNDPPPIHPHRECLSTQHGGSSLFPATYRNASNRTWKLRSAKSLASISVNRKFGGVSGAMVTPTRARFMFGAAWYRQNRRNYEPPSSSSSICAYTRSVKAGPGGFRTRWTTNRISWSHHVSSNPNRPAEPGRTEFPIRYAETWFGPLRVAGRS